ncbi:hypothetical protein FV226_22740 [Methylobacterium sp. WL12]|uniref:hypothetical protein n=1 Tax=Methylobacterium sp. WL12 TaxID=2603890 RepID=UPI0011CBB8D0|nr:hypothetical protein [Methylobacterium sp. WL12]TXM66898.1 hypothetical protein FV226_22740 [Methylobacterium sp. WL12]
MIGAPTIPEKVRRIVPSLGSSVDGEALGACRAIGRTLGTAGLDFHDLARAIPTGSDLVDNIHEVRRPAPKWDAAQWRSASTRPAPEYRPSRRKTFVFTPTQSAIHRRMALYCRNADRGRLSDRERAFIAEISTSKRELSVKQLDWLSTITDRLDMQDRHP